jgi:glycerol-3-phosphate dehydrogenase (NAD(P)+)
MKPEKLRAAVIGDGGWGTALALRLHRNGHDVRVWGPFPDYLDEIRRERANRKFLPGVPLPEAIAWEAEPAAAAAGADLVVLAVPSAYFAGVATRFAPHLPADATLVSVTKGLDAHTHRRMTVVAGEILGKGPVAALSGPSFAEEVAREMPTAVVVACADAGRARRLQRAFGAPAFRVYTSDDPAGVEFGGALKNVIAIAAGISDGIGFGHNAKAALMTRGLAEIARLGVALGARAATFSGLSGLGDLVLTCTGRLSRNRGFGERLGRGERAAQILAGTVQVVEGAANCASAVALAREAGVRCPITEEVDAVINQGKDPREAVRDLLTREMRPERDAN